MSPLRAGAQKTPSHDSRSSDTPLSKVSPARCKGSAASHMLRHRQLGLCVTFVPSSEDQHSSLGWLQSHLLWECVFGRRFPGLTCMGPGAHLENTLCQVSLLTQAPRGPEFHPKLQNVDTAKHTGQGRLMLSPRRVAWVIVPCSCRIPVGLDVPTVGG